MADLHTDDWLDVRFDAAVDDLDRVLAAPHPLTSGDFRRPARRHNAGRAVLAVGMVGGTLGALVFVARDPASPAPVASPTTEAAAISAAPASVRPTVQTDAWEAAVSATLQAVGWPYPIQHAAEGAGQAGSTAVAATLDAGSLLFEVIPWAPGEYSDDVGWQRGVAGATAVGEPVAEGTLFVSDAPPTRSASIVTPRALVRVSAEQADVDAIGGADSFADVARLLARAVPSVLAGEQLTVAPTPTASLQALAPSQEYFAAVFAAREIVIENCMAQVGYEYRARPNDAAGTGGTWDEWERWHDQQVAANPDFDAALFGGADEQIGGCQADAYRAVHGPGEEAYSKAAALENQLRGEIHWLDLDQAAVDQWITEHAQHVQRVRAELDEELQTAQTIIENASS
ncbi:MAG TPA: hypothetical protein DCR14_01120 [Acidimicrobiaceae bacterium]|nr:hypothetical protein [Acidimicrobiaceae bacterium]